MFKSGGKTEALAVAFVGPAVTWTLFGQTATTDPNHGDELSHEKAARHQVLHDLLEFTRAVAMRGNGAEVIEDPDAIDVALQTFDAPNTSIARAR